MFREQLVVSRATGDAGSLQRGRDRPGRNFRIAPLVGIKVPTGDDDKRDGRPLVDSVGTRLFLTPGVQCVTRRWIGEAAVQVPVVQDLNGAAVENDYVARLSVRFNF